MVSRVIYIHGFNSSEQSAKAQQLGRFLADFRVDYRIPRLGHEAHIAMAQLAGLITPQTALIGSSLGGYYATWLSQQFGVPAVLVNPAVRPFELFEGYLGPQYNPYQDYHYELAERHVDALKPFYLDTLPRPELLCLMQQTGDEVLPYQQAVGYYKDCKQHIEFGGDHSFIGFERRFADIVDFLKIT